MATINWLSPELLTGLRQVSTWRYSRGKIMQTPDVIAVEEPLEIRLALAADGWSTHHSLCVTMRTPGQDFELVLGLLFSEGIIDCREDVQHISYCQEGMQPDQARSVVVELAPQKHWQPASSQRHVVMHSGCGICGRPHLDSLAQKCSPLPRGNFLLSTEILEALPERLRKSQELFRATGGLHAAALLDSQGRVILLREDVGRHNAMDKLIGALLEAGDLPASDRLVLVSGRASFELVQKALRAGIPALLAIGAPSTLAIQLASQYQMTLIGFLRPGRFNIYSGLHRLAR